MKYVILTIKNNISVRGNITCILPDQLYPIYLTDRFHYQLQPASGMSPLEKK